MKRFLTLLLILSSILLLAACGGQQSVSPAVPAAEADGETGEEVDGKNGEEAEENASYYEYLPEAPEEPEEPDDAELTPEELAAKAAAEAAARDAELRGRIAGMTREEKVGQMFFARCPKRGAAEKIAQYHLGGVLLFARDFADEDGDWLNKENFTKKLEGYQEAAQNDTGIALFIGSDEEGGTVTRASRDPYLFPERSPSPQALYAEGGIGAILNDASEKSYLLRGLGINVNFAPVCDVATDKDAFIYDRTLGQDAETTAAYVARVVAVMDSAGVGSVLKHFPGYGNNIDTHTGVAVDERPYEQFDDKDFLPFEAGIEAGAPFVLVSHNVVNCMDAVYPASLSPTIHRILRGGLRFEGVILTDDLAMDAVGEYAAEKNVAVLAVQAGNDMIVTTDFETQIAQVLAAVEAGTISEKTLDDACLRILRVKDKLGLLGE